MPNGVVKWFSKEKGYGFIVPEGDAPGKDVFVHHSSILMKGYRILETGQRVTYKEKDDAQKGPMAFDVIIVGEESGESRVCPTCHQVVQASPKEA